MDSSISQECHSLTTALIISLTHDFLLFLFTQMNAQKNDALVKYQNAVEEMGAEELEAQRAAAMGGTLEFKLHTVLLPCLNS